MPETPKEKNVILLLDAYIKRRTNLNSKLQLAGYETELTNSGFHALSLLEKSQEAKKGPYCMVLLVGDSEDMPAKEVLLLMRNIEQSKKQLPILFIHEDDDPDIIMETIVEGANDYIVEIENNGKILGKVQKIIPI